MNQHRLGRREIAALVAILAVVSFSDRVAAQVPCSYEVSVVLQGPSCGIMGQAIINGSAISPNGEYVVGDYSCPGGGSTVGWVYRQSTGQATTFPFPPGISTVQVEDVNDDGLAVGRTSGTAGTFAFVFDINANQYLAQIPPLVVNSSTARFNAINSKGMAVGTRTISNNPTRENPFIYDVKARTIDDLGLIDGLNTTATGINDSMQVCGWRGGPSPSNGIAFVYFTGRFTLLGPAPGSTFSTTGGMNRSGTICVGGGVQGFLWNNGFQPLPCLDRPYDQGGPSRINDFGTSVGACRLDSGLVLKPVAWFGATPYGLSTMVPADTGLRMDLALDISNDGSIIVRAETLPSFQSRLAILTPLLPKSGDTNCDSLVNIQDVLNVISRWGPCNGCIEDLNGDHIVNVSDLLLVIANWD